MIPSLKGGWLPSSLADFILLRNEQSLRFERCYSCSEEFTEKNVFTSLGWRETQISGTCEECFNEMFKEDE